MRAYVGYSDSLRDVAPCIVVVRDADEWRPLARRTGSAWVGWGWGCGGPAANELAWALLADHLGYEPPPAVCQRFVWEVVGRWAQGRRWQLTAADIEAWLARAVRRGVIPALPAR